MANPEHVKFLLQCQGDKISEWNAWREANPKIVPNLSRANLSGSNLREADLGGARLVRTNLQGADLTQAYLWNAKLGNANLSHSNLTLARLPGAELRSSDLSEAVLRKTNLRQTDLEIANLTKADLTQANLVGANLMSATLESANLEGAVLLEVYLWDANLRRANLSQSKLMLAKLGGANLTGANLTQADLRKTDLSRTNLTRVNLTNANLESSTLLQTILEDAHLDGASVNGMWVQDVNLSGASQHDLVITPPNEPVITVDNLKVAQFIYLLLNNPEIREVIDTITSKAVLILGRFTPERKAVLDALRTELRKHNYSPILFDFEKPSSRDLTETVRILAHLARFIIADLTEPSSIPQELQAIVPDLRVPVQPVLLEAKREYAMFVDFKKYAWVLPTVLYQDVDHLLQILPDNVIQPAETLAREYSK